MRRFLSVSIIMLFLTLSASAQMVVGADTLLGHEWINFDQDYFKIQIEEDGMYRLTYDEMVSSGIPVATTSGSEMELYLMGAQVPIYISTEGTFSQGDYIEFYGVRNRSEMDRQLYVEPDKLLNPEYSLYTDVSSYFLTWQSGGEKSRFSTIVNDISNPPAALPFYLHTEKYVSSERNLDSRLIGNISLSSYREAEGFGSIIRKNSNTTIQTENVYSDGPDAEVSVRFATSKLNLLLYNIQQVLLDEIVLVEPDTLIGISIGDYSRNVPASSLKGQMTLSVQDVESEGTHVLSVISITYPRTFEMQGKNVVKMNIPANDARSYIELLNFDDAANETFVYDLTNKRRIEPSITGSTIRFGLPSSAEDMEVVVITSNSVKTDFVSISEANLVNHKNDNTEFIVISHPTLFDPDLNGGVNHVQEYCDYRKSESGGSYNARYYNIFELYDTYGYGVNNHPQAIRNFAHFAKENWPDAKIFFIIGKGIEYPDSRVDSPGLEDYFFVPTFGLPGADNLLVTTNTDDMPIFPIGRISVINSDEISIYLSKVKEYETAIQTPQTIKDREWMHRVMHLVGGQDASQQQQLEGYMNNMGSILENGKYGADLYTFTKSSTNPVGQTKSEQIIELLHQGISIVNFFGHSSASTLDFQVNNPGEWNNKGKYPIFSAMGCKAGQMHNDFRSLSETFTFAEDAGTIAFLAGSGEQYIQPLNTFGRSWYRSLGDTDYGNTLAASIMSGYRTLKPIAVSSVNVRLLLQQQSLQGDPALKYYTFEGPDFVPDFESVRFSPEIITTKQDSFDVIFDIVNLGRRADDSISIQITQEYPNGQRKEHLILRSVLEKYRNSFQVRLPLDGSKSRGKNRIFIAVDSKDEVVELPDPKAEQNNDLFNELGVQGIDLFVIDNRMIATQPREFSIVNSPNITLVGTSSNAFIKGKRYVMEIDTTERFNSPLKKRQFFNQFGSVVKWSPEIIWQDESVYYWRVSLDSISPQQGYVWDQSSFIYLANSSPGWNQSHYYQLAKDDYQGLQIKEDVRKIEFQEVLRNIWIKNQVVDDVDDRPLLFIDGKFRTDFFEDLKAADAHVFVVVLDSFTTRFIRNSASGDYGSENPTGGNIRCFPFNTSSTEKRAILMNFLENEIDDGNFVLLYSYQRDGFMDFFPQDWAADSITEERSLFSVIENEFTGSGIRQLEQTGSLPFTVYYQKGKGGLKEKYASDINEIIDVDYSFISRSLEGEVKSTIIGPSNSWHSIIWDPAPSSIPANDQVQMMAHFLSKDFSDTLTMDLTMSFETQVAEIDAKQYPYLQLQFYSYDLLNLTASSFNSWRVMFDGKGDLITNPTIQFTFNNDTIGTGQNIDLTTAIENIGTGIMEPSTIDLSITNVDNSAIVLSQDIPQLSPGENHIVEFTYAPVGLTGPNNLFLEVNPRRFQFESETNNNFGLLDVYIEGDQYNPILEVTFDGIQIRDGAVVSTRPKIDILVKDENLRFPIVDTANVDLAIRFPSDFNFRNISKEGADIQFIPADTITGENQMIVHYLPEFFEEGIYDFRVQAKDVAGNRSGDLDYLISFEIVKEQVLFEFTNYPNPFNSGTRFKYTLTGEVAPQYFGIRIYDMSGRLIREIGEDELGELHVGSHITEYEWNGTDSKGAILPSGFYIYEVVMQNENGANIRILDNEPNSKFKAGYGYMIIVR